MIKAIGRFLLFKVGGFRLNIPEHIPEKCIIALAPHTSNWDFIVGILYSMAVGVKYQFLMKKEWFFGPLGFIMRTLGGIPVNRKKNTGLTEQIATQIREAEQFHLCITPEGTRKPNAEWKKGFYYIAQKADIPILLFGLDYERKLIECTKIIRPTGDIEEEMLEIKDYFRQYKGKHPEKFCV